MAQREIVTEVTNAILYSDGTILLKNVRASYPHLTEPYMDDKDRVKKGIKPRSAYNSRDDYIDALLDAGAKYSIVGMLDKKTHVAAKDLIVKVIDDIQKQKDTKVAKDKKFISNGDDSAKTEYEGHFIVSARESKKPNVRDRKGEVITSDKKIDDLIFAGCYVNMLIRPWFQDNEWGKRINAGIVGVQYVKDGDPIGEGTVDDEGVFDPVEDEGDDGMGGSSSNEDDDDGL